VCAVLTAVFLLTWLAAVATADQPKKRPPNAAEIQQQHVQQQQQMQVQHLQAQQQLQRQHQQEQHDLQLKQLQERQQLSQRQLKQRAQNPTPQQLQQQHNEQVDLQNQHRMQLQDQSQRHWQQQQDQQRQQDRQRWDLERDHVRDWQHERDYDRDRFIHEAHERWEWARLAEAGALLVAFSFLQPQPGAWYGPGLVWDPVFHVWELATPGAMFGMNVFAPQPGPYNLVVTHMTYVGGCPGGGYSPVSITVNGEPVVTNYDVAENFDGVHTWVTEDFPVYLWPGENHIEWVAGPLCSPYWIQNVQIYR
jgi:hypothetical protein